VVGRIALLTTVTDSYERIPRHGVGRTSLEKQAESLGLPLEIIYLSQKSSEAEYENRMKEFLVRYRRRGEGNQKD
jgi:diphthamide synthase (EF-2-diphthine--ammonia ligase)